MRKRRPTKNIQRSWESPSVDLTNPASYQLFSGDPTLSGTPITKHTVWALPAFRRGVDMIANTVGGLPYYPYRTEKNGGKAVDDSHAAYTLLNRKPNQWQTAFEFKRQLVSDAVWNGNSYCFVARDDNTAEPTDLVLLDPEETYPVVVRNKKDVTDVRVYYLTHVEGNQIVLPFDSVIHVKSLSVDSGWMGMRLIDRAKEVLGLGIAVIKYGAVYFKHSGSPSIVVEFPEFMRNKEQIEQFRQGFYQEHGGVSNAHKLCILQGGAKLAKSQISNEEAQFLASRQMSATDCANLVGLPSHFLNVPGSVSYGSLEQESLSLILYSLDPWITNLEEQFEKALLRETEKKFERRCILADRSKLKQADTSTSVDDWIKLTNNGLCKANFAAAQLNLPQLGEEGDELRIPSNVVIQGEEPDEPPAQQAQQAAPDTPGDAPADQGGQDTEKLRSLTRAVLERFLTRLERAASKGEDPGWLDSHRDVFGETLEPLGAAGLVGELLGEWGEELRAVTRDQQPAVFARVDREKLVRRILG